MNTQADIFASSSLGSRNTYPPRYGVFMTYDKYEQLVQRAHMEGTRVLIELLQQMRQEREE